MIIDHVDNLELSDEEAEQYYNELNLLRTLAAGLNFLNHQTRTVEDEVRNRLDPGKYYRGYGNVPWLEGIPRELISCAFRWYSVTVCDYVKIVGWLCNKRDTRKANAYLRKVIPEVHNWRNKVGAHSAFTDPRGDTPADLFIIGTTWNIGFEDDAFAVGTLTASIRLQEGDSTSRQDRQWSLTHTHQQLSSRYWPTS